MICSNQTLKKIICSRPSILSKCLRLLSVSVQEQPQQQQLVYVKEHSHQKQPWRFPGIWLRDNCQCPQCFHKDSLSRKISWQNFDTKVKVEEINCEAKAGVVRVKWSDKHTSSYDLQWLEERDFSKENHVKYINEWYRPATKHWSQQEFEHILHKFDYKDIMEDDGVLLEWLEALAISGVSMLKNAPQEINIVKSLANRIGFIRKTTYGEEFSVISRPGAKNYSYLSEALPLHTDLPYYEYKPSVTLLHTLVQSQSTGGFNTLTDSYNIADQLRSKYPQLFKTLTETRVDWSDIGADGGETFHNILRLPVINLDADGKYTRINHSILQRDNHFTVDIDKVQPWYEANARFVRMAHEQAVTFKTTPGDVLTFNNLRMLHGRTGYDDTTANVRHIIGGFVDWDIVYSKRRVLKKTLAAAEIHNENNMLKAEASGA